MKDMSIVVHVIVGVVVALSLYMLASTTLFRAYVLNELNEHFYDVNTEATELEKADEIGVEDTHGTSLLDSNTQDEQPTELESAPPPPPAKGIKKVAQGIKNVFKKKDGAPAGTPKEVIENPAGEYSYDDMFSGPDDAISKKEKIEQAMDKSEKVNMEIYKSGKTRQSFALEALDSGAGYAHNEKDVWDLGRTGIHTIDNGVLILDINVRDGMRIDRIDTSEKRKLQENKFKFLLEKSIRKRDNMLGVGGIHPAINMGGFGFGSWNTLKYTDWETYLVDNQYTVVKDASVHATYDAMCCEDLFVSAQVVLVHSLVVLQVEVKFNGPKTEEEQRGWRAQVWQRLPPMFFNPNLTVCVYYHPVDDDRAEKLQTMKVIDLKKQCSRKHIFKTMFAERWFALFPPQKDDTSGDNKDSKKSNKVKPDLTHGIAVFFPYTSTVEMKCFNDAIYIAPGKPMDLLPKVKFNYTTYICVGSFETIRATFSLVRQALYDGHIRGRFRGTLIAGETYEYIESGEKVYFGVYHPSMSSRSKAYWKTKLGLYKDGNKIWESDLMDVWTNRAALHVEDTGDFVVINKKTKETIWSAGTGGNPGAYLRVFVYKRKVTKIVEKNGEKVEEEETKQDAIAEVRRGVLPSTVELAEIKLDLPVILWSTNMELSLEAHNRAENEKREKRGQVPAKNIRSTNTTLAKTN